MLSRRSTAGVNHYDLLDVPLARYYRCNPVIISDYCCIITITHWLGLRLYQLWIVVLGGHCLDSTYAGCRFIKAYVLFSRWMATTLGH